MDFKIGDEIEENPGQQNKQSNSKLPIIIVVVISLLCGLTVFLVSNAIFNKKEPEVPLVDTPLELTDDNVKILYTYVTYGTNDTRNDKFIKESRVTLDSFSNEERFYYALQFAQPEDFVAAGRVNENKQKVYIISNSTIKSYMQRFFGGQVTYSNTNTIKYPFNFRINGKNVGELTYSDTNDGYETVFTGLEEKEEKTNLVEPYYTELASATKKADGSYELVENVIYTQIIKENDKYTVYIYKDYNHTMLLETKPNQTDEMLKENPIDISNYKDKTSKITYIFKVNGTVLYFDSSTITN